MSNGGHHPETDKPDTKTDPKKNDTKSKTGRPVGKGAGTSSKPSH